MTTESVIGLTAMSIYTILAGIALIAAGATYFITRRLSGLTERLDNTVKNMDKLDDRNFETLPDVAQKTLPSTRLKISEILLNS
jgi:uncharacterized ion transporter superfamily protein YfcC